MESASQWIVLAHVLRPQGRKGEVIADLFTDFPGRFRLHPRVWLAPCGFADSATADTSSMDLSSSSQTVASSARIAEVDSHWLPVGRNAGRVVLHFSGITTIEQAQQLVGNEVLVPRSERKPLEADASYISDLIGCTVFDRDRALGSVADVQFPTSPDGSRRLDDAAPLLSVITLSGDELLIPYARAFLLSLDPDAKSIHMALPDGLSDLNLQPNPGAQE